MLISHVSDYNPAFVNSEGSTAAATEQEGDWQDSGSRCLWAVPFYILSLTITSFQDCFFFHTLYQLSNFVNSIHFYWTVI